ncbi:MAG: hypothetical protein OXN25_00685 [Candidatus Poribacteria bacterium]|nr:hypothetical protein [Candidatus Poribacteria bacterium]MYK17813.1 hypothetical protein [Candidatus Poribacteria bacterium]
MKTQILLRKHTPVSIISFFLLLTTTLLGCNTINRALEIDAVLLTLDDLRTMGVRTDKRIGVPIEHLKELHIISAYEQRGTQLTVQYWLFASASAAKKAAEGQWIWFFAAPANFHPQLNPEDVIGDATWHRIHRSRKEWENGPTDIWFVKYNLLVSVRTKGHPSNRLQFARDTARKIEAEINAIVEKK